MKRAPSIHLSQSYRHNNASLRKTPVSSIQTRTLQRDINTFRNTTAKSLVKNEFTRKTTNPITSHNYIRSKELFSWNFQHKNLHHSKPNLQHSKESILSLYQTDAAQGSQALSEANLQEGDLAYVCEGLFKSGSTEIEPMEAFIDKYPTSLYPVPMYYATALAQENAHFDEITSTIRNYLKLLNKHGVLEDLLTGEYDKMAKDWYADSTEQEKYPGKLRDAIQRSFLLLTAAYTHCGARSYSKRVLFYGNLFPFSSEAKELFINEIKILDKELEDEKVKELDDKWEKFFKDGSHYESLVNMCRALKCPNLGERLEWIKDNLETNPDFKMDEKEMIDGPTSFLEAWHLKQHNIPTSKEKENVNAAQTTK